MLRWAPSHTPTATWSSAVKKPKPFTQSVNQLHLWAKSGRRLTKVCVCVVWLRTISRLGFPMMIMTCMIGMCYLLATHVGLGWNMWVQAGRRDKDTGTSGSLRLRATSKVASNGVSLQAPHGAMWRRCPKDWLTLLTHLVNGLFSWNLCEDL